MFRNHDVRYILLLLGLSLLTWIPRFRGPIDLRYDAGVSYILGTSLAEGKGYRLLNEPGKAQAIQYPPLLPAFVQSGRAQAAPSNPTASTEPVCLRVQLLSGNRIHAGNGRAFSTTPLSYGSRLVTMAYGLLLVIESWQLHVLSVTQVLTVLSVATLDSMHVLPIPAEA